MLPLTWKSWSYGLVRIGLASAFLAAGAVKMANPMTFAATIDAFGILPGALALPVAVLLPVVEILGALALLLDIRGSLTLITLMILIFIVVLGYGLHMGLDIDCGCYGPGDPEAEAFSSIRGALWRDLFLLGCAVFLYAWRRVLGVAPQSFTSSYQSFKTFMFKEESV